MTLLLKHLRQLREETLYFNPVRWVFDTDTYVRARKDMFDWWSISPQGDNLLLGLPFAVVLHEPRFDEIGSVRLPDSPVKQAPKLLAIEYRNKAGLTRYAFSDDTDEEFKA